MTHNHAAHKSTKSVEQPALASKCLNILKGYLEVAMVGHSLKVLSSSFSIPDISQLLSP